MGDLIAQVGFDGRALAMLLLLGCVAVIGLVLWLSELNNDRSIDEHLDRGSAPQRVEEPAGDSWEDDPELAALDAEVGDLLRSLGMVSEVEPPAVVWDRIEAALNRPPLGDPDVEWAQVVAAVEQGRADFGDASSERLIATKQRNHECTTNPEKEGTS